MFCPRCKRELPGSVNFCKDCGVRAVVPAKPAPAPPRFITVLAVLTLIGGIVWVLVVAPLFLFANLFSGEGAAGLGIVGLFALLSFACSYGLWTFSSRPRFVQYVMIPMGLILSTPAFIGIIAALYTCSIISDLP